MYHMPVELSEMIQGFLRPQPNFKVGEVYEVPYQNVSELSSWRGYIIITAIKKTNGKSNVYYNSIYFDTSDIAVPTRNTKLTVSQIKYELRTRGLSMTGNKAVLLARMWDAIDRDLERFQIFRVHLQYGRKSKMNEGSYQSISYEHKCTCKYINISSSMLNMNLKKKQYLVSLLNKHGPSDFTTARMQVEAGVPENAVRFMNPFEWSIDGCSYNTSSSKYYVYDANRKVPMLRI